MGRLRGYSDRHPIAVLIAAWATSRALLIAATFALADYFLPDVYLYSTWTILLDARQFPVGDAYWQYPPGAGVLFALSGLVGPNPVVGFVILAVLADAAILGLLIWAARRQHRDRYSPASMWSPWAWVIGGIAIGPIMLARFDLFPTLFAVAAIVAISRPWLSGLAAGLGGLLKVWPVLMLAALPRRQLWRGVAAAAATAVIGTTLIAVWASGGVSFLGEQGERGLQIESVGALPYVVAGAFGVEQHVVLRYGAFEIVMPGAVTIGLALTLIGALLIGVIGLQRLRGRLEAVAPGDVALALVLISVATSRVFSPQYSVWIVGVAAAASIDRRSRLRRVTVLLIIMAAVTSVLFPWLYGSFLETEPLAVLFHFVRISLLLVCTVTATCVVLVPAAVDRMPVIRRVAPPR
ncbi:MAG: DUF2029 domain-containing protein [Actinobacteria bacterium]|uniref:Unannotated protein n=1 Tax=freshwater metagenome TaxID=449393 RepID=A0A6J7CJ56_9ZZZZ|nr:DUF2029 domain-containing protein [Actinomycetota bacterium]